MGVTTVVFGIAYFAWRLTELVRGHSASPICVEVPMEGLTDPQLVCGPTPSPPGPAAYILLFTDIFTWSMWLPGIVCFWTLAYRDQADMDVKHPRTPAVDVMIPACGEPSDIIMDTVRAALAIDYNPDKLKVYLLDDGGKDELKDFVLALKKRGKSVEYIRRSKVKGVPHHAKAGNLNHALSMTSGEFVACFDSDMLAHRDFLRRTLPHMSDEGVALVQTPQSFYNVPPSDSLSHRMTFVNLVLATADRHNSCPCIGTGWLVRRQALVSIGGGFTYGSVSEDFNTTRTLHLKGWSSRYVNEFLQAGIAPDTLVGTVLQRQRWCMGNIQMLLTTGIKSSDLTFLQRVLYACGALSYIAQCFLIVYAFVPVGSMIGIDWITADAQIYPRMILGYIVVSNVTAYSLGRELEVLVSKMPKATIGYLGGDQAAARTTLNVTKVRDASAAFWMAPYIFIAILRVMLPFDIAFRVTGASTSVWRQDFDLVLPFIVYIVVAVATWMYRLFRVDFNDCIEMGSFLTFSIFFCITIQQFIPPVSYVLRRYGRIEKDRKSFLDYDENGTPTVNWGMSSGGSKRKKFAIVAYSLIPVLLVLWLALTVYVTTTEETLGWECNITAAGV